ncbi:hypothetical protein RJ640_021501 [Escallonia rubra]|uniref:Endonuclease/exonuclease/phosphatase domain-containing protein n=1 Tax=Escallonia rubra TaxID=112253 RepID=A0AA88QDZ6_9ASTE|nr:hypothetical protein RJ640_021501 [Escallonia rubra]
MRDILWENLTQQAKNISMPWILAGDFNDYMGPDERRSFKPFRDNRRCQKFRNNINECGLIDLGCSGPKLTWTNSNRGLANTQERLDRALVNSQWLVKNPSSSVTNLPRTTSDHSPILIRYREPPREWRKGRGVSL